MQLLSESNALNLIFPKLALCAAAVTGVTGFTEPVPSLPRLVSSSQDAAPQLSQLRLQVGLRGTSRSLLQGSKEDLERFFVDHQRLITVQTANGKTYSVKTSLGREIPPRR